MSKVSLGGDLYAGILGAAWDSLDPAVHTAHLNGRDQMEAHATFSVRHGRSWIARLLAWIGRLPAESEAAPVKLSVRQVAGGELWDRAFPNTRIRSIQLDSGDGLLTEKFGLMEVRFRLSVANGALSYAQAASYLTLGPLRIRIPQALSMRISAVEKAAADGIHPHTSVTIAAPLVGLLAEYEGDLIVEG
jgi:hypothetical protein